MNSIPNPPELANPPEPVNQLYLHYAYNERNNHYFTGNFLLCSVAVGIMPSSNLTKCPCAPSPVGVFVILSNT